MVEVGQKLKAQHAPQAHRHVGVAGEVEVDLEGEGHHAQPGPSHRQIAGGHGLIAVPQHAHVVGNQDLLPQTDHKHLHAGAELINGGIPLVDLVAQVFVLDNGTGNELGEQGDKGAEVDDVALGPGIAPVHVDGVAHGLEGVEGDADGQVDTQHRHKGQADGLERGGQEIPVLEEQQQEQIKEHGGCHCHFGIGDLSFPLKMFHQHAVGEINGGRQEHNDHIGLLSPVVEDQRGDQNDHVAQLPGNQIVDQQGQDQKIE